MYFRILGRLTDVETIAVGAAIREIARLRVHWYEATGVVKREFKIKRYLD